MLKEWVTLWNQFPAQALKIMRAYRQVGDRPKRKEERYSAAGMNEPEFVLVMRLKEHAHAPTLEKQAA